MGIINKIPITDISIFLSFFTSCGTPCNSSKEKDEDFVTTETNSTEYTRSNSEYALSDFKRDIFLKRVINKYDVDGSNLILIEDSGDKLKELGFKKKERMIT